MADVVRELAAKLGLDFNAGEFLKAELAFSIIHKAAEKLFGSVEHVVDSLAEAVTGTAEQAEALQHLNAQTGIGVEDLQELGYVAQRSNVSMDSLAKGVAFLGRNALEASKGGTQAQEAFSDLGVSIYESNGQVKDGQKLLLEVGNRLAEMPNKFLTPARAMKLFGRAGAELIPIFAEGSEGIEELREQARNLGNVMSEDMVNSAARLNGVLEQLKSLGGGLAHDFAGPLLEPLQKVGEEFLHWYMANRQVIRTGIEKFAKALWFVLEALGKAVLVVVKNIDALLIALGALGLAIFLNNIGVQIMTAAYINAGIAAVAAGIKAAAAWAAAALPLALMAALITLIALAAEDLYQFLTGGDSLIGDLGPKWTKFLDEFLKESDEDPWWLAALKQLGRLLTDIQGEFPKLVEDWKHILNEFVLWVKEQVSSLPGASFFMDQGATPTTPGAGPSGPLVSSAPSLPGGPGARVLSSVQMPVTINAGPGQNPREIADAVGAVVDERIKTHLQEAAAATM